MWVCVRVVDWVVDVFSWGWCATAVTYSSVRVWGRGGVCMRVCVTCRADRGCCAAAVGCRSRLGSWPVECGVCVWGVYVCVFVTCRADRGCWAAAVSCSSGLGSWPGVCMWGVCDVLPVELIEGVEAAAVSCRSGLGSWPGNTGTIRDGLIIALGATNWAPPLDESWNKNSKT